jgi:hypothetical protein
MHPKTIHRAEGTPRSPIRPNFIIIIILSVTHHTTLWCISQVVRVLLVALCVALVQPGRSWHTSDLRLNQTLLLLLLVLLPLRLPSARPSRAETSTQALSLSLIHVTSLIFLRSFPRLFRSWAMSAITAGTALSVASPPPTTLAQANQFVCSLSYPGRTLPHTDTHTHHVRFPV